MRPFFPTSARRSVLAALTAVLLIAGPLAFVPAGAAASTTLSGRVTDSALVPISYVDVSVWVKDELDNVYYPHRGGYTDRSGRFTLDVEPGTYKLQFGDYERYRSEFYNDKPDIRSATAVVVDLDGAVLDDVVLEALPLVEGVVTTEDRVPVRDAWVVAYRYDAQLGWDYESEAATDERGRYRLPVREGTYRFGFYDEEDAYVPEFWDDQPAFERAKDVTVAATGATGINAALAAAPVPVRGAVLNHTKPSTGGFAAVGHVLQANDGMWFTDPGSIREPVETSRQWLRNGVPVPGATGTTYPVTTADLGATLSIRVTGTVSRLTPLTVESLPSGVVRWNSKVTASSKPGRNRSTLSVRVTSYGGGTPTGTITIKLRNKVVKTVWLSKGRRTLTLKKLRKSQKYDIFYDGDRAFHPSRVPVWVKITR